MFAIALFELRTRLKLLSTYVYFVAFAAAAALWMTAAGGVFTSANIVFGSDKVFINAPYALAQTIGVLPLDVRAMHIDAEGYAHSVGRDDNKTLSYNRGTSASSGRSWTWNFPASRQPFTTP